MYTFTFRLGVICWVYFEVRGNDAPRSEFFREHSGNWVKLVVIKERLGTCYRNMLCASMSQKKAAGGRRLCLSLMFPCRRQETAAGFPSCRSSLNKSSHNKVSRPSFAPLTWGW